MIALRNIHKTYISKSKQKVHALQNIDLEIGDSGLVFILGKSGSGKSTLLNLLGGIDSATSGEISVDGVSFSGFRQRDLDTYRNRYVGFIFQEFNLLRDFNVQDNVSVALRLSREDRGEEKVVKALEQVELSAAYLTRKIDELSGGEKQRVAIARAIVKNSRMILADEPTGNLDSATGESIWGILKNLSETKLVIVVTHDRDSAEKYADRIIEISDGKIVSDVGEQPIATARPGPYARTKQRLSAKAVFRMGVNNLLQRKAKAVSVVLLAVFTVFALLVMQMTLSFSAEKSFARFISDNDIDYITVTQGKLRFGNEFRPYNIIKPSTIRYVADRSRFIPNGVIGKKQDILDMGFSFVGEALEIDDHSFYLTEEALEETYKDKDSCVEIDGELVKLVKEQHPIETIVGKKIGTDDVAEYALAGVVKTNDSDLVKNAFPDCFWTEGCGARKVIAVPQNSSIDIFQEVNMQFGQSNYSGEFTFEKEMSMLLYGGGRILTAQGLQAAAEVELADDELVLTYELYAELFSVSPEWSYVNTDLTEVLKMPPHIGQRFDLVFSDRETGELFLNLPSCKLVGISFSREKSIQRSNMLKLAGNTKTANRVNTALDKGYWMLVQISSVRNLQKFLVDLRKDHAGYIMHAGEDSSEDYATVIYSFEHYLYYFKFIFAAVAFILSAILVLVVVNLISFSIVSRKKEIGILSALGTSSGDLTKIFLVETLLISVMTFVVNIAAIVTATVVLNNIFSRGLLLSVPLMRVGIGTIATLIGSAFGLLLVSALIPIRKTIKLKPIDAIKDL